MLPEVDGITLLRTDVQMELGQLVSGLAWRESPRTLRTAAVEMLQVDLEPADDLPFPEKGLSAVLPVIDVGHRLELTLAVAASSSSTIAIARALMGDPPPTDAETLVDLLGEVVNIAMGSVKSIYGREGYVLTAGLPEKGAFGGRASFEKAHGVAQVNAWKASGIELVLGIGARVKGNAVVQASHLLEDMILARDLLNDAGVLILPKGTRLTATAVERLRNYRLKGQIEVVTLR
jgi:hypothetical protein